MPNIQCNEKHARSLLRCGVLCMLHLFVRSWRGPAHNLAHRPTVFKTFYYFTIHYLYKLILSDGKYKRSIKNELILKIDLAAIILNLKGLLN